MVAVARKALFGITLATMLLPLPASAQETLEKIQNDVAAIVKVTRSAVVSIEDERLYLKIGDLEVGETIAQALREAEKEIQRTTRKSETAEGSPKSEEARKAKADAAKHLQELRENMSGLREQIRQNAGAKFNINVTDAPKSGTGFCIGEGLVVTTADVLNGMKTPVVVLDDMTRIKATVVGMDMDLNIGLLKLPPQAQVAFLKWGNSNSVQIGHFAISIGNQNGQTNSVSLALVAGLRSEGTFAGSHFYPSLIQIAGTVGAGSSGAPLINPRGEIIAMLAGVPAGDWSELRMQDMMKGLIPTPGGKIGSGPRRLGRVTARAVQNQPEEETDDDPQQSFTFIRPPVTSAGFAIPVNLVKETVDKLRSGNPIRHAWIGITPEDVTEAKEDGAITTMVRTVRIKDVYTDSPACKAGLREGDVLISLNGKPIKGADEVRSTSAMLKPGEVLHVVVRRGNEAKTFDLNIEKRPEKIQPKKLRDDKENKRPEKAETRGAQQGVIHTTHPPQTSLKERVFQPIIV